MEGAAPTDTGLRDRLAAITDEALERRERLRTQLDAADEFLAQLRSR